MAINLENFLVHYATYSWQNILVDITKDPKSLIFLFGTFFLLVFLYCSKKNKRKISKSIQTEFEQQTTIVNKESAKSDDFLLNYIFNHNLCSTHILTSWIANFNDFQQTNFVSKKCQILNISNDVSNLFKCSEVKIIENKEIFSFTFRLNCEDLTLLTSLKYKSQVQKDANIAVKNLEIMALVIVRVSAQGLLVKFCPETICRLNCDLSVDGISLSEREMSVTELTRDFKLVMLQTIEMEWGGQIKQSISDNEICRADGHCQTDFENSISHSNTTADISESTDTNDLMDTDKFEQIQEEETPRNVTLEHNFEENRTERLMSHASIFTANSSDYHEPCEESPFHDRFSNKLVGRTLVVSLGKLMEASELRVPLKKGYCVLELDEPYQRHVSHLISLADYPVWNQHFIFSLNANSQRLSVELFQVSKKCQNPTSLGVSLIPISLIIFGQSENYFPININQFRSRLSWRCDNVAGNPDSKIPSFAIEFQIMTNVQETVKSFVDQSSERSSNSGVFVTTEMATKSSADSNETNVENGNKMQSIPESETPVMVGAEPALQSSNILLRPKHVSESHGSKSVMRKLRHRFSQLSMPWMTQKSKSDDCLDQLSEADSSKNEFNDVVPVQPPAELFFPGTRSKLFARPHEFEVHQSRGLSSSLKKMLNFQNRKSWKNEQFKDKSLENLFKEMDPKMFDTISKEGFDRIMNNEDYPY